LPFIRAPIHRFLACALVFGGWLAGAQAGAAQSSPSPQLGPEGSVGAHVGASLGVGTLKGVISPQVGGRAGVDLLPWLRAGGEGNVVLNASRLARDESPHGTELTLGYGGVFLEMVRPSAGSSGPWSTGILVGAGTARIRSPSLGSELDSRNFFLLEPSVARRLRLRGPLVAEGRLAYRLPLGPEPMVGVRPGDLRGGSLRITLFLVRSP
jgi:hypothetical protein